MPVGSNLIDRPVRPVTDHKSCSFPAVIVVTQESSIRIATLTVLDRLIVAVHRAGAAPITVVCSDPLPALKRTRALGIPFEIAPKTPQIGRPTLLATGNILVQPADVRRCIESHGRLVTAGGEPLTIGVVDSVQASPELTLANARSLRATGVAHAVTDAASARFAERALWASLTSSSDGLVDRWFNRPCGRPVSKLLIHTPITPNTVSIISIIIGVISAILFTKGTYGSMVLGALLLQLSAVIDCVDGDIARVVFKETPVGKWIDLVGDQIVHLGVFAGIALGVSKSMSSPLALWLGVSAVAGALLSFVVVLRGMKSEASTDSRLKRLIDAATNRDFSVLVLLLAAFDLTRIFLWLAAIGSHLFWITALAVQFSARPPRHS